MHDDDLTLIGEHYGYGRNASASFGIARAARRQGLHLIGQSRTGKSMLMLGMLCQDIARGEGVTFIDPNGLNAEWLLDYIPPSRLDDVCYFNVADALRPVPFNILETDLPPEKRHLAVSAVVAAFSGIWKLTPERAPVSSGLPMQFEAHIVSTGCIPCRSRSLVASPSSASTAGPMSL
jgi:hypothetical protein